MTTTALLTLCGLLSVMAFVVLATRLGYPRHRRWAVGLYFAGWLPFWAALYQHRRFLQGQTEVIQSTFHGYGLYIGLVVGLVVFGSLLRVLFPVTESQMDEVDHSVLTNQLDQDLCLVSAKGMLWTFYGRGKGLRRKFIFLQNSQKYKKSHCNYR